MLLHVLTAKGTCMGLNATIASTPGAADALQLQSQGLDALATALGTFARGDVVVPGRWAHVDAGRVRLSDVVELQEELKQLLRV